MPGDILEFVSKINNASVVTRYPEDFSKLIAAFPESVAREYLDKAKEAVAWLKRSLKSERS
jgi:HEPN domain-containing protein